MKFRWLKAVSWIMAGILLMGCGGESNENPKTEPIVEQEKEETAVSPTPEAESDTEEEKLEIELPEEEELVADYTSVDGLILEEGTRIAFVVKNTETGYWKAVKKGVDQAINDLNQTLGYTEDDMIRCTFEGPKSEVGVDEQVNILDAVIAENPVVLCLAAVDMDSCVAQLESAEENGIPVIVLDSGVASSELVYSVCATDNYAAGAEAARHLCEAIDNQGEVAVLSHLQLGETSQERVRGFEEEIKNNHPDVTIVEINYEPSKAGEPTVQEQMRETLEQYPELKGYFCTNEVMGKAALEVLKDYEERNIQMVGFDLGSIQEEAIRNGIEAGVVCQNPYGMGYATVVAGVRAALDMENDAFIDAGFQWIDQSNLDLEENSRYLYE
ncbi:MAG: ABC transporter substrate-binding protein [Oliverpabstia sp.]